MDRQSIQCDHELQRRGSDLLRGVREEDRREEDPGESGGGVLKGILPGQMTIDDFIKET